MESEPGDMCGGFGSLAQQGFPARFPGRSAYRQIEYTSAGMQEGAASPFLSHPQRRTVENPIGRLGGPKPSKYNPNPATCAAGSEALRSKVSLRVSPAAPPRRRGNVSWRKMPAKPAFFDKRKTVDKALSTALIPAAKTRPGKLGGVGGQIFRAVRYAVWKAS